MKRPLNRTHIIRNFSLALCASSCAAFAQGPGPGGPGDDGPPPPPPVVQALDANHDGVVDSTEIANSPRELQTLLQSGSNALSIPDLLGPPPPPRDGPPPALSGSDAQVSGSGNGRPPGPPPNGGPRHHHPPSPLMQALDTNHDGILQADEIANATASLKKLDKNSDGQITQDELRPPPPPRGAQPPPSATGTNAE